MEPGYNQPTVVSARYLQRQMLAQQPPGELTQLKNDVFLPLLRYRLQQLHDSGLPVPEHWLNPSNDLLELIQVHLDPTLTKSHSESGYYMSYNPSIVLTKAPTVFASGQVDIESSPLLHELLHYVSGISQFENQLYGDVQVDRMGLRNYLDRSNGSEILNEATTEALTRWVLSSKTPDFGTMTCKEFFDGPSDIPPRNYMLEQQTASRLLGDMPVGTLLDAYFDDSVIVNGKNTTSKPLTEFEGMLFGHLSNGYADIEKAIVDLKQSKANLQEPIPRDAPATPAPSLDSR